MPGAKPTELGVVPEVASPEARTAIELKRPGDETLRVGTNYRFVAQVRRFKLTAVKDPKVTVLCSTGRCEVGTHASNALVLTDPTVSRFHCEVWLEDQRALVRDLLSSNGTFVDGVRVREGYLRDGSVLTLGKLELRFELDPEVATLEVSDESRFGRLVGESTRMRSAFRLLEKAARSDATVLLEGETGTGKSKAAQALHEASARAGRPFLVVDCGALPASLLEAELFGHEKGAFTGAAGRRLGAFEEAEGGTVLLDEIGELPLELQPKLLRVLEEKQVRRLGRNQWTPVDVRLIAATHRDLRAEVNAGRFRSDLFFRLAVVRVTLPPLRDHPEDVPEIARGLLHQLGATPQKHPHLFTQDFLSRVQQASWPGNARELRNYLERCLVLDEPLPLGEGEGGSGDPSRLPLPLARRRAVDDFERRYLQALLTRHGGKVSEAAVEAEVDRVYLYRLMRRHGIRAGER